jgi:hypothetical protein
MRRALLLALALLAAVTATAAAAREARADEGTVDAAAALAEADRAAIRGIIERQIEAFRRDDGAAAFGFASPAIQRQFGTPENFLSMVRRGYAPVYRPQDVAFGPLVTIEGRIVQRVTVVGPDGRPVLALYIMEQQPDGTWRINGCILTTSDEKTT